MRARRVAAAGQIALEIEQLSSPPKLRRSVLGYRRSDVLHALERQHEQITALAASLDRVWTERATLREELTAARAQLEELGAARQTAAEIVAHAEAQASFLRGQVERYVSLGGERLQELLRVRQELLAELRELAEASSAVALAEARTPARATRVASAVSRANAASSSRRVQISAGV